jgi:hypothetical protein
MKRKLLIIAGALFVARLASTGIPYVSFPAAITTGGGMGLNYLKTLSTPVGTVSTEANSAYKAPEAPTSSTRTGEAAWPTAAAGDWPTYSRTPSSQRYPAARTFRSPARPSSSLLLVRYAKRFPTVMCSQRYPPRLAAATRPKTSRQPFKWVHDDGERGEGKQVWRSAQKCAISASPSSEREVCGGER